MKNHDKLALVGLIFSFCLFFLPVLVNEFAYSDDFFSLEAAGTGDGWIQTAFDNGRPLQGKIVQQVFAGKTVTSLFWSRLIGLGFLFGQSVLLFFTFRMARVKTLMALCGAFVASILPTVVIPAIWPSSFPACVSTFIGFLGGFLCIRSSFSSIVKALILVITTVSCLLIYQAGAPFVFIPFVVLAWKEDKSWKEWLTIIGTFIATALVYLIVVKMYQEAGNVAAGRTTMTTNYLEKLAWYIYQPLKLSASGHLAMQPSGQMLIGIIFIIGILGLAIARKWLKAQKKSVVYIHVMGITVLLFLTGFHLLAISANWFSYRTGGAISWLVWTSFVVALSSLSFEKVKHGLLIALILFSGFQVVLGYRHIIHEFVDVQTFDWKLVNEQVELHQQDSVLYVIRPERIILQRIGYLDYPGSDEYGIPSSAIGWATDLMYFKAMDKQGMTRKQVKIVTQDQNNQVNSVIQMETLYEERLGK